MSYNKYGPTPVIFIRRSFNQHLLFMECYDNWECVEYGGHSQCRYTIIERHLNAAECVKNVLSETVMTDILSCILLKKKVKAVMLY